MSSFFCPASQARIPGEILAQLWSLRGYKLLSLLFDILNRKKCDGSILEFKKIMILIVDWIWNQEINQHEQNYSRTLPCKHQVGSWICSVPYATPSINNEDRIPVLTMPGSLTTTIIICAHNCNLQFTCHPCQ